MIEALIGWLILAQTVRWSHGWVAAISWGVFGCLVVGWLGKRKRAALRALWRSPLLPVVGAAALSALANGGWWSRVADWALYAVMLAWLLDQKPDIDRQIVRVGRWVMVICLFEFAGLVLAGGDLGWRVHLLGNSNVVAALLLVALMCERDRRWWLAGLAALLATGSRCGLLGLALYGLLRLVERFKLHPVWIVVPGLAVLGILMAARMVGTTDRIEVYGQAVEMFVAHPLAGIGPGLYRGIILRPSVMVGSWHYTPVFTLMHAHNLALTALAEGGAIGLAGWVFAVWRVRHWHIRHTARLAALLPVFVVDDMTMYWLVVLGVLYVLSREVETE